MFFQVKPDLTYLRSFGCLCFVSTTTVGRDKFMPKAHPCVFIGYQFGQKAYKMYNLVTKKLLVSRDVRFFENIDPLHALTNNHLTPTYSSIFLLLSHMTFSHLLLSFLSLLLLKNSLMTKIPLLLFFLHKTVPLLHLLLSTIMFSLNLSLDAPLGFLFPLNVWLIMCVIMFIPTPILVNVFTH